MDNLRNFMSLLGFFLLLMYILFLNLFLSFSSKLAHSILQQPLPRMIWNLLTLRICACKFWNAQNDRCCHCNPSNAHTKNMRGACSITVEPIHITFHSNNAYISSEKMRGKWIGWTNMALVVMETKTIDKF
jgi:hypothetical protein